MSANTNRADKNKTLKLRYNRTLDLLKRHVDPSVQILDMGTPNEFSRIMQEEGYNVINTKGEDLDLEPETLGKYDADVVTGFEILEHLLNPFGVMRSIKAKKVILTVPLRLWFKSAYRNPSDPWDQHFHEFEDWQFDWLLEKSGWKIIHREKWTSPINKIGIRPLLRRYTPRYYAVVAEKNS